MGECFILNSYLYKVKTAIAAGGTINVGTNGNAVQTTVEAEIQNNKIWVQSALNAVQTTVEAEIQNNKIWVQSALPTVVGEQIDNKFGDDIGDDVSTWLTEHVTPTGSAVVVDDTLTINGAAADAKKTGDEITALKNDYTDILNSAYVTDTASGSIASFPDGADNVPVKSLKVNIEPVQDLHGYNSPWPGGGGKNLIPMTLAGIKAANTDGIWSGNDYTRNGVTFTVNTNSSGDVVGITVNGTATKNAELNLISNGQSFLTNGDYILSGGYSSLIRVFYYNGNAYYDTKPNPINITIDGTETNARCTCVIVSDTTASNVVLLPMIRKSTETDPTFEPYSNICPIIGWTGAKVTRTGKNLIPYPYVQTTGEVNGITFTDNGNGTITANGTSTASAQFVLTRGVENKKYLGCILSGSPSSNARIRAQVNGDPWTMFATDNGNGTVITDSGYKNIRFILQINAGVTLDNAIFRPMLRAPSDTDATYTPSVLQDVYNITFPTEAGTVYGGTLDVTSGVLTVDRAMVMLKDQSIVQRSTETSGLYRFAFRPSIAPIMGENLYIVKSNALKATHAYGTYSNRYRTDYVIGNDTKGSYINFFATDLQTVEAWQSFANDNNVQVMWKLANPFTVQLTANEISTILGQNNIWADTGDVDVEYRADTKLYIEKLTAPTEDAKRL